ncbi:hypothetical protein [Hyphococcus sp.]|uniref:hypothetical protein n=1 Tax=Hyphococcus sp. TaxID=2038636 RepID=UPI003752E627
MQALTHMIATGWPLALAAFFLGAVFGGLMAKGGKDEAAPRPRLRPGDDGLSAVAAELQAARELLAEEEAEAGEVAENLQKLDEAIKRANGRLKLLSKAVKQAK